MEIARPGWSSSSFLLYAGGLVVLLAAAWGLQVAHGSSGSFGFASWALLVVAVLQSIAFAFRRRGEWTAGGVFAFAGAIAWGLFAGAVLSWWGWLPGSTNAFQGFHAGRLLLLALLLAWAAVALRLFRFPLIVAIEAFAVWYLVTDVVSDGGNWSAVVTFVVGGAYLIAGTAVDRGPRRPYGFWWHLASGLLIGGALLHFLHAGTGDWIAVAIAGVLFVALGVRVGRSSWTVLGALGLLATAAYFGRRWTGFDPALILQGPRNLRPWVPPVVLAVLGFLYAALGLAAARRPLH